MYLPLINTHPNSLLLLLLTLIAFNTSIARAIAIASHNLSIIPMPFSKLLIASLLISLLLLHLADADQTGSVAQRDVGSVLAQIDCKGACGARCRLSSRPRLCQRACGTCCRRCNCVPPGTAGNQEVCPCYANMTTHGGRRKCP